MSSSSSSEDAQDILVQLDVLFRYLPLGFIGKMCTRIANILPMIAFDPVWRIIVPMGNLKALRSYANLYSNKVGFGRVKKERQLWMGWQRWNKSNKKQDR